METMMIMDSSKPLYLQVEADIKNRILSKQYMPGDKLPTENELSDQYNVSKITIRKAIQNLSDEGYVNKVQGKGTFINFKKDKLYLNKTRLQGKSVEPWTRVQTRYHPGIVPERG